LWWILPDGLADGLADGFPRQVKFEALQRKYDNDLGGLIELRLQLAEAKARVDEYETKFGKIGS